MYAALNLTLGVVNILILLILIVCQVTAADRRAKTSRLFLAILLLMVLVQLSDMATWSFNRVPGMFFLALTRTTNFLAYSLSILVCVIFTVYISESIPFDRGVRKIAFGVTGGIAGLYFAVVVVSQFNGMIYSVDSDNRFHWGAYYWVANVLTIVFYIAVAAAILRHRKKLGLRDTLTYLGYSLLPLLAVAVNTFFNRLTLSYMAMTFALLIIFVNIQMQREKRMKEQELELQTQQTAIMLSQIQPHFLYNSLAAINDLCRDNPEARQAILAFSKYLRANMDSLTQKKLIPFEKELEHTRQFLWLSKLRFEERLTVLYDIQTEDFQLPALTLQPIVENAVQHGILERAAGGTVEIRTEQIGREVRVTVVDDGVGFEVDGPRKGGRSHVGIDSVRSRLDAMCGGTLTVTSRPGQGTTAVITVPGEEDLR